MVVNEIKQSGGSTTTAPASPSRNGRKGDFYHGSLQRLDCLEEQQGPDAGNTGRLFRPFVTFRREVDRIFDNFFDGAPVRSGNGRQLITPAVDVDETDKEMIVTAELPGVSDKDVEVSLAGDLLTAAAVPVKREVGACRITLTSEPMHLHPRQKPLCAEPVRDSGW